MENELVKQYVAAAKQADWKQVVLNGGPPCFHLEGDSFCLRARRWEGHDVIHPFISLAECVKVICNAEPK